MLRALVCAACGHTTFYAKEPDRMGPRSATPAGAEVLSSEAAEADTLAQRAGEPEAGGQDWLAAEEAAVVEVPTAEEVYQHSAREGESAGEGGPARRNVLARLTRGVPGRMGKRREGKG